MASRRGTRLGLGLLAASALVVGTGVVLVGGTGSDAAPVPAVRPSPSPVSLPPVECPAETDPERLVVPMRPTGFDGEARLVPDAVPARVTVCRYESGTGTLVGTQELEGDLSAVPDDLYVARDVGVERVCTLVGGPRPPYLVRLDYTDETGAWLATREDVNSCTDVTNGSFTSPAYVGQQLVASFDSGTWARPTTSEGVCGALGYRAGEELALVPRGWTSLRECGDPPLGGDPDVSQESAEQIADLLEDLPTVLSDNTAVCEGGAAIPGGDRTVALVWSYPRGRNVLVRLTAGCEPALSNSSLGARADRETQLELLGILQND